MADKKITALTELTSTGKVSSTDLLHIIDYSASPVNKKITVSNLLKDANTAITSFGAFTHDLGPTNAISGLSVVVPNATPAASAETEVVVNDDGNAFVDFRVESSLSPSAIHVDASLDSSAGNVNTVTINGNSAKVDFKVNSDTGILVHCDSTDHVVGIGLATPDTAYMLDLAAVGSGATAKSIKAAGGADITGNSTVTGTLGVVGSIDTSTFITQGTVAHSAAGALPLTHAIVNITIAGAKAFTLADGTDGQTITFVCVAVSGTPDGSITPTNRNGWAAYDIDAVGESLTLQFSNSKWNLVSYYGGSVS